MKYMTFKGWVQFRINSCAELGGGLWPLNDYKYDYRKYLTINVKPYDKKLAKQLSDELKKIKTIEEIGVDINPQ